MWKAFEGEGEGEGEGEDVGWSLWSPWFGMGNTRQRSMVTSAQHYWSISGSICRQEASDLSCLGYGFGSFFKSVVWSQHSVPSWGMDRLEDFPWSAVSEVSTVT